MNQRASADKRFPLELADKIALALVAKLAPFCAVRSADTLGCAEKNGAQPGVVALQIAGSIRRRRPDVGDIDLVAIPKLEQVSTGLFTTETQRPRDSRLATEFCSLFGRMECRGDYIIRGALTTSTLQLFDPSTKIDSIGIDFYLATADTWATTLLIRTGSAAHNIWLCARARELGGKLHAGGEGLELPGEYDVMNQRQTLRRITPASEDEIFKALCAGDETTAREINGCGVPPELREIVNGKPVWLSEKAERR